MRLIDADEVYDKRFTVVDVIEGVPVHRNVVKAFDVREAPTVDAIPIERVEKLAVRIKELSNDNPSYWNVCDVIDRQKVLETIEEMLEDWRKENE